MAKRIAVVISQGQSANPAKRQLEEDLVASLLFEPGVDVIVVPHLYDLKPDGTGALALQGVAGNLIVLSWLYERAARWTLDRFNVRGLEGVSLIKSSDDDEEDEESDEDAEPNDKTRVIDNRPVPQRRIYCIDLRVHNSAEPYIEEVKRIARENSFQLLPLSLGLGAPSPTPQQLQRMAQPTNDTALPLLPGQNGMGAANGSPKPVAQPALSEETSPAHSPTLGETKSLTDSSAQLTRIEESLDRRWYPVIDYSRCTNCMECIDFCLFGVYGVDKVDTILVEQPDNCRKGCPACSRVCPENAIIFPQHKTPTIAGAAVVADSLKIDLSKLFGAPDTGESAEAIAIRERDEQLMLSGRSAVGATVGLPKRQSDKNEAPKDDLDSLLDALDDADL